MAADANREVGLYIGTTSGEQAAALKAATGNAWPPPAGNLRRRGSLSVLTEG